MRRGGVISERCKQGLGCDQSVRGQGLRIVLKGRGLERKLVLGVGFGQGPTPL